MVGITEGAVQRILNELESEGYLVIERVGRRNHHDVNPDAGLLVGWYIPSSFVGDDTERYIFALFIAAGLAQAGGVKLDKLAFTVIGVAVFFALAFTVGQRMVNRALRNVRSKGDDPLAGLTVVLVTALSFGVITQWLHVEAVLGAFAAGVILAHSRFADHELIKPLEKALRWASD